ncbi:protein of unknown function [Magnetospira sp. QH-2]|nr:protein of unknown function [Magnetospira sp. QH-2]
MIESGTLTTSTDWDVTLDALFQHMKPPPPDWVEYLETNNLQAEFSALWIGKEGATEPLLSAEQFDRICSYRAEWDMTPTYHDGHDLGWY